MWCWGGGSRIERRWADVGGGENTNVAWSGVLRRIGAVGMQLLDDGV